jgi:hypothetical protein
MTIGTGILTSKKRREGQESELQAVGKEKEYDK